MRLRALLPALLAIGLLFAATASSASALELLNRFRSINNNMSFGGGCGCGAPEMGADCGCAPVADCCAPKRCHGGLLRGLFHRHKGCGCDVAPACGCDAAPACGCDAAPACGCDAAPDCGCAPKRPRGGLLRGLFHRHKGCGCDAAPACGCDAAPACGCGGGAQPMYLN